MKRPQWITVAIAIILVILIYKLGRIVPKKRPAGIAESEISDDIIPTDTILAQAKKKLSPDRRARLTVLERSIGHDDPNRSGQVGKDQQLKVYHELAHFWSDSARLFEPFAWYEAEAARLENSEKSLTFAAHLFLQNLRGENDPALKAWEAFQAKDLFERSLKINPKNDSSTVGLGACYIFGGISSTPMEGIMRVRTVADKDSTNIFAQEVLGHGSMISGQYDRAIGRFEAVYRLSKKNITMQLEACLMLAEAYEKKADIVSAISWYEKSLAFIKNDEVKAEIRKRIEQLK